MREKYSINLTPPTQKEQTPTQLGKEEEESVRMEKAERGSSALPAGLPHRELPGGGAFQTLCPLPQGTSRWPQLGCNELRTLSHTMGPAKSHPCRASESSLDGSTTALQLSINANSVTSSSLQNQNPYLGLFMSNLFRAAPKWQG